MTYLTKIASYSLLFTAKKTACWPKNPNYLIIKYLYDGRGCPDDYMQASPSGQPEFMARRLTYRMDPANASGTLID